MKQKKAVGFHLRLYIFILDIQWLLPYFKLKGEPPPKFIISCKIHAAKIEYFLIHNF